MSRFQLRVRATLALPVGMSLLGCQTQPAPQRRATWQREFHLSGRAAIAVVKPQNAAGRLGPEELRFLGEFNRAADSLERAGYFIAVSFRDTIVVVPPPDSFHLSPWTLVNHGYPMAYVFAPGRDPYYLPTNVTSKELLLWTAGAERTPRPARVMTVRPMPLTFRSLSLGDGFTCGLTAAGQAFCWGENTSGQLGNGTTSDTARPAAVASRLRFIELSSNGSHTCGRTADGRAFCWGGNAVGRPNGRGSTTPVAVAGGLRFVKLAAGQMHSCGLTKGGKAFCWGSNGLGQLGDGTKLDRMTPVPVAGGVRFVELAAGGVHTCGRTAAGKAFCWGDDGTKTVKTRPVAVAGGLRFVELDALGYDHTCGRTADGRAFCWGANREGELGDSTTTDRITPTAVAGGLRFVELSAGDYHTCGRTREGLGFCWGGSNNGERGDGVMMGRYQTNPAAVAGGLRFVTLRAGGDHTCGLTKEGAAFCWGWNGRGALGDGTTMASLGPVQVVARP